MPVPQAISLAFERYGEAMDSARRNRRTIDGFLGIGSSGIERCQDDFVSELRAAVEGFAAAGPDSASAREALEYIFSRARAGRRGDASYWMLLASHSLALPLVDFLSPADALSMLEAYEASFPKRERFPAQKAVISALRARGRD